MIKRWVASILAITGLAQPASAGEKVQTMDPKSIMFTVPTISDDLAQLEPISNAPKADEPQMHEDDWCQVEFFSKSYLPDLQRMLTEYKSFEASNRQMTTIEGRQYPVWRNAYIRKVSREALLPGKEAVATLAEITGGQLGPAPVIFSSSSWSGRVKNGFTVRVGRNVDLYGYQTDSGIPVLAASVGPDPDDQSLVEAFAKLNVVQGLVLVDWKSQFILVSMSQDGKVQAWQP